MLRSGPRRGDPSGHGDGVLCRRPHCLPLNLLWVGAQCVRPPSPWHMCQVRPLPVGPHVRLCVPCGSSAVCTARGTARRPRRGPGGGVSAQQTRCDGGHFLTGPDRELQTVRQAMIDFLQNHTDRNRPPACPRLDPLRCAVESNFVKRSRALSGAGTDALRPALLDSTKSLSFLLKGPVTFFLSLTTLTAVTWRFYLRATARTLDERYRVCVSPVLPPVGLRGLLQRRLLAGAGGHSQGRAETGPRARLTPPWAGDSGRLAPGGRSLPAVSRRFLGCILNAQPFCSRKPEFCPTCCHHAPLLSCPFMRGRHRDPRAGWGMGIPRVRREHHLQR